MKILRSSILCICAAVTGLAQVGPSGWTSQLTGNALRAVALLNGRHAVHGRDRAGSTIAVGDQGTIVRTTDGGATWTHIPSGTDAQLMGVAFANVNTGI